MKIRTLAATAAVASAGSALLAVPALAGMTPAPQAGGVVPYDGWPQDADATVSVTVNPEGRSTFVLRVSGLEAGRTYGAHAHVAGCDPTVKGGGHWQRKRGTGPAFANPGNEMWLDVTVGADGTGSARATQDFTIRPGDEPRSVIIHAWPTGTGADDAGVAGAKLACVPVQL